MFWKKFVFHISRLLIKWGPKRGIRHAEQPRGQLVQPVRGFTVSGWYPDTRYIECQYLYIVKLFGSINDSFVIIWCLVILKHGSHGHDFFVYTSDVQFFSLRSSTIPGQAEICIQRSQYSKWWCLTENTGPILIYIWPSNMDNYCFICRLLWPLCKTLNEYVILV